MSIKSKALSSLAWIQVKTKLNISMLKECLTEADCEHEQQAYAYALDLLRGIHELCAEAIQELFDMKEDSTPLQQ